MTASSLHPLTATTTTAESRRYQSKKNINPHSYLFRRHINGRLVVKRRDRLGALSRLLRESLYRGRGAKSKALRSRWDCFGDGGQHEAAEPRPGSAAGTAQHLCRSACESWAHLRTIKKKCTEPSLFRSSRTSGEVFKKLLLSH